MNIKINNTLVLSSLPSPVLTLYKIDLKITMKFYVEILLKTVVMTGLSAVFWLYFCVPSYQTYTDLQTFLAESSTPYQERMMPAVSVWSQEEDTELLYHNIQESATLHFSL